MSLFFVKDIPLDGVHYLLVLLRNFLFLHSRTFLDLLDHGVDINWLWLFQVLSWLNKTTEDINLIDIRLSTQDFPHQFVEIFLDLRLLRSNVAVASDFVKGFRFDRSYLLLLV